MLEDIEESILLNKAIYSLFDLPKTTPSQSSSSHKTLGIYKRVTSR